MIEFEYLTNPEKYHTVPPRAEGEKDEQYKARLRAYVQGIKSQQAKIDEINEVANGWKDEYRIMSLRYERSKKRIDELQARIDEALKAMKHQLGDEDYDDMQRPDYDAMMYALRNIKDILKGNKDEN